MGLPLPIDLKAVTDNTIMKKTALLIKALEEPRTEWQLCHSGDAMTHWIYADSSMHALEDAEKIHGKIDNVVRIEDISIGGEDSYYKAMFCPYNDLPEGYERIIEGTPLGYGDSPFNAAADLFEVTNDESGTDFAL